MTGRSVNASTTGFMSRRPAIEENRAALAQDEVAVVALVVARLPDRVGPVVEAFYRVVAIEPPYPRIAPRAGLGRLEHGRIGRPRVHLHGDVGGESGEARDGGQHYRDDGDGQSLQNDSHRNHFRGSPGDRQRYTIHTRKNIRCTRS